MLRKLIISCLLAGIFVSPAAGAIETLMPGVTYEKRLQFTRFGPMRLHILTAPKPDGVLYKVQPVLSNGSVLGRERVTTMQRRAAECAAGHLTADENGPTLTS